MTFRTQAVTSMKAASHNRVKDPRPPAYVAQKQTYVIQIGYTQSYKLAKDPKLYTKTQQKRLNLKNPALFTKMKA